MLKNCLESHLGSESMQSGDSESGVRRLEVVGPADEARGTPPLFKPNSRHVR